MKDYPKDPMILLSWVNTQLRDHYSDLRTLCDDMEIDCDELKERLGAAGFEYNEELNKFW